MSNERKDAKSIRVYPEDWATLKRLQLEAALKKKPSRMADIIRNLLVNRGKKGGKDGDKSRFESKR